MTDTFQRNLAISGGLHLAVVAMIFFKTILVPSEPIEIRRGTHDGHRLAILPKADRGHRDNRAHRRGAVPR